ncbi:MAG: diacylglycerol/lipid kinase family protein [Flavobacteriales bacterium]
MRAALIYNPLAGKRQAARIGAIAARMARELGATLTLHEVAGRGHGTVLAREAIANGAERVVSVGGDGTNNAIARALVGTNVPLGIVAMGSGNGYARSIGLPLRPEPALRHALTAAPRRMDVCYLNDELVLGNAGVGFDARVAHRFERLGRRGMLGYARIIAQEILGAKPMRVVLKANAATSEHRVLMLVFCNTREFGNGVDISPSSQPDDGVAELRVVRKPSLLPLLKAFFDAYTHRVDRNPHVLGFAATEAQAWQEGTLAHIDGEPVELGHHLRFRLEARRLLVVA